MGVREAIEQAGAGLLFLSPYSPTSTRVLMALWARLMTGAVQRHARRPS
jgi:transposase